MVVAVRVCLGEQRRHVPLERSEALFYVVHAGIHQCEPVKDSLEIIASLGASFARLVANLRKDLRDDAGHGGDSIDRTRGIMRSGISHIKRNATPTEIEARKWN